MSGPTAGGSPDIGQDELVQRSTEFPIFLLPLFPQHDLQVLQPVTSLTPGFLSILCHRACLQLTVFTPWQILPSPLSDPMIEYDICLSM